MLLAYQTGMIRATQGFKIRGLAATGAMALFYLVEMTLGIFFPIPVPMIHQSRPIGIASGFLS
jgi:uncharacterized YccA/Bax inhibitor family protein